MRLLISYIASFFGINLLIAYADWRVALGCSLLYISEMAWVGNYRTDKEQSRE